MISLAGIPACDCDTLPHRIDCAQRLVGPPCPCGHRVSGMPRAERYANAMRCARPTCRDAFVCQHPCHCAARGG